MRRSSAAAVVVVVVTSVLACHKAAPAPAPPGAAMDGANTAADDHEAETRDLEQLETSMRASTDWRTFPSSDKTLGPDPVDVVALPGGGLAGALRGADAVVRLAANGSELARVPGPRATRSLAVDGDTLAAVGELDARVMLVKLAPDKATQFGAGGFVAVDGVHGLRGVALAGGDIYVTDVDGNLLTLDAHGKRLGSLVVGAGALHVERAGDVVVVDAPLAHRIVIAPVDKSGVPDAAHVVELKNDGPFWGFTTRVVEGGAVLVAAGHVEDHVLDRRGGSFGYIDSFVSVWRVEGGAAQRVVSLNTSELGVVIPKALAFLDDKTVLAVGSGSGKGVQIDIDTSATEEVKALPGITSIAVAGSAVLGADALLDAWVLLASPPQAVPVPVASPSTRSADSKLGEALVFTTIMAPRQKSDGVLSRFTCEACHFEGGGDGRVHDTGRRTDDDHAAITATTKPLFGLFNNKPLFTRALDPDLATMAHAEFRVANANSSLDPWFALTPADAPWLSLLGVSGTQGPTDLRRALVTFLHDFTPRTNANAQHRAFTDAERRGAALFRDRCAACHTPRLIGDDDKTRQPFEKWEALVLSENGPLVWAGDARKKTGIEPYVHPEGARPSSLRRIARKVPYFTNGAAKTLAELAASARFDDSTFLHLSKSTPAGLHTFTTEEQQDLVAFLELL